MLSAFGQKVSLHASSGGAFLRQAAIPSAMVRVSFLAVLSLSH